MSLAGVFKVEIETLVLDVPTKVGLYYRHSSGAAAGFPSFDLVTALDASLKTKFLDVLATTVLLMRIIGRPLDGVSGPPYEANYVSTVVGTGAGADPLPPSVAALVKLQCTSPNSRNNSHIYIAGVSEVAWVAGEWAAGFVADMATLSAELTDPVVGASGATYTPCVVSRYLAGMKRFPPVTFDLVTCTLMGDVSQQRRRQSGRQGIKS